MQTDIEVKDWGLSLKENVEMIKEELNAEEKFFEKAVVTERFLQKYKKAIIGFFALFVIVALGNVTYTMIEQNRLEEANEQLNILLKNPSNTAASKRLEELSPKLYEVWSFAKAVIDNDAKKLETLSSSKLPIIGDMATYEAAVRTQNETMLQSYEMRQLPMYKDLAIVEEAVSAILRNDTKKAKEKLAMIEEKSPVQGLSAILAHYGIK